MAITLDCPSCGRSINVPDTFAGKKVKCPQCEKSVSVPAEDFEAVTDEPRSPEPTARRPRRRVEDDEVDVPDIRRRTDDGGISSLIPYKNGKALVAYYCGVFSLIPCVAVILGPLAFIFGLQGLRFAREHPRARGAGHAWAGIILGSLTTLAHLALILIIVIAAVASKH